MAFVELPFSNLQNHLGGIMNVGDTLILNGYIHPRSDKTIDFLSALYHLSGRHSDLIERKIELGGVFDQLEEFTGTEFRNYEELRGLTFHIGGFFDDSVLTLLLLRRDQLSQIPLPRGGNTFFEYGGACSVASLLNAKGFQKGYIIDEIGDDPVRIFEETGMHHVPCFDKQVRI